MSKTQIALIFAAAGGLVVHTFDLISMQVFVSSLDNIISLVVTLVVALGLYVLAGWCLYTAWRHTRKDQTSLKWVIATIFAGGFAFWATVIPLDVWAGEGIRTLPWFSGLPEGNLLVAGGRAGWVYIGLIALVCLGIFLEKLPFVPVRTSDGTYKRARKVNIIDPNNKRAKKRDKGPTLRHNGNPTATPTAAPTATAYPSTAEPSFPPTATPRFQPTAPRPSTPTYQPSSSAPAFGDGESFTLDDLEAAVKEQAPTHQPYPPASAQSFR